MNIWLRVRVFHKGHEMSKVPLTLRDDRLHASLCTMACSFMGLKSKNKPKPATSLSEGL